MMDMIVKKESWYHSNSLFVHFLIPRSSNVRKFTRINAREPDFSDSLFYYLYSLTIC